MYAKYVNIGIKIALCGLLVHAVWFSDLPQYKDKAIALRVVFYPLAAFMTTVIWVIANRHRKQKVAYPYAIDICITTVVAFDMLGNTLGLYDSVNWWDDLMHLVLSIPWVLIAGFALRGKSLSKWVVAGLVIGFGSTSHIIWELLEYVSFVQTHPVESLTAYRDTMGDLALSLVGTVIGAVITTQILMRPKSTTRNKHH
jgi:glycopeptide antibiotics resistance protein